MIPMISTNNQPMVLYMQYIFVKTKQEKNLVAQSVGAKSHISYYLHMKMNKRETYTFV